LIDKKIQLQQIVIRHCADNERTFAGLTLLYMGRFLLSWPVTLRYQSLCSL